MKLVETIKIFLNIHDDLQDDLLNQIVDDMTTLVLSYTNRDELHPALEWIVRELSIIRFNRIGSEGMASESEEGKSMNFVDDPLLNYYVYLDPYVLEEISGSGGKAKFL